VTTAHWPILSSAALALALGASSTVGAQPPKFGYAVQPDNAVHFSFEGANPSEVRLAGDFTAWSKAALAMTREGDRWVVATPSLETGAHFYKFIVDGEWKVDPANPMTADDGKGSTNSALGIGGTLPAVSTSSVRILSLNLHTYQEADSAKKLEQVAFGAAAVGADILLLQEVGEHVSDPEKPNAGEVVRDHLQRFTGQRWEHQWRRAHLGFDVYHEGLSILSSAELTDVREIELSGGSLRRNALMATTTIRGIPLRVVTVHSSWPAAGGDEETRRLLKELEESSTQSNRATIVGGDFNATPTDSQMIRMVEAGYTDAARAAGSEFDTIGNPPNKRIDYQFLNAEGGHEAPQILAVVPLFAKNVEHNTYLPLVSDHIGMLGVYDFPMAVGSDTEVAQ